MYSVLVLIAAISFTVGGIYMKLSQGLSQLVPSLLIYIFFTVGASLQTLAMNKSDLGVTYLLVLGLESVLALLFSVVFFKENYSSFKILGLTLIVSGIILLRAPDTY